MRISKKRVAIDLGTNSFRMLIASVDETLFTSAHKELRSVRLGERFTDQKISSTAIERGISAIKEFMQYVAAYPDIEIIACGTAVFRQANNSKEFLQQAEALIGNKIKILSSEEEAYLSSLGTLICASNRSKNIITIDAGGGSTELSFVRKNTSPLETNNALCSHISIPVGAVLLTEEFLGTGIRTRAKIESLREYTQNVINIELDNIQTSLVSNFSSPGKIPTLIASGGTATALACLDLKIKKYDAAKVQGHILSRINISDILNSLTNLSPTQANDLTGLDNKRGEIIIGGLVILETIADYWLSKEITVSDTGLLEGIFLAG